MFSRCHGVCPGVALAGKAPVIQGCLVTRRFELRQLRQSAWTQETLVPSKIGGLRCRDFPVVAYVAPLQLFTESLEFGRLSSIMT